MDSRERRLSHKSHDSNKITKARVCRFFSDYSRLSTFELSVKDVECFINHESTRKFLVLKLNLSNEVLCSSSSLTTVDWTRNRSRQCCRQIRSPFIIQGIPSDLNQPRIQCIIFLSRGRGCHVPWTFSFAGNYKASLSRISPKSRSQSAMLN